MAAPATAGYLPGTTTSGQAKGLFHQQVRQTLADNALAAIARHAIIAETDGDILLKRKVSNKLGFTKELNNVSKLAIALGGKVKAKGTDGKVEDDAIALAYQPKLIIPCFKCIFH